MISSSEVQLQTVTYIFTARFRQMPSFRFVNSILTSTKKPTEATNY